MDESRQQLINTWLRNQEANMQIFEEIDELNGINQEVKKVIYSQFAHIHTIRIYNIEKQDKKNMNQIIKISGKDASNYRLVRKQLSLSANAIAKIVKEKNNFYKIKSYSDGCIGWIVYLINHESHHRSKVISMLKEQGFKFSKRLKFDLWNWK